MAGMNMQQLMKQAQKMQQQLAEAEANMSMRAPAAAW